ncbi:MAG: putative ABC transport system permease protein [Saprospiraceae bacterium]|jgi:putative ABC transport system permease protein
MFDYDKWQEIFGTIRKNKLRTFLTALGVFWGVFMLVFLMGMGKGLENGVTGQFSMKIKNSLFVWTQRTTIPYKGMPPGRYNQLTTDDVIAIRNEIKEVNYIAPRVFVPSGEITHGNNSAAFDIRGELEDVYHIMSMEMAEGRFLNELDEQNRRKIAVIGERIKEVLFEPEEEAIGNFIKIRGTQYKVVGVFKSLAKGEDASEEEQTIYIPLSTAQQITNRHNEINWFVCTVKDEYDAAVIDIKVKDLLKKRHRIHPDDPQGVRSNNVAEEFGEVMGLFTGISIIVWIVGIGSLMAGVIGVGNIMLIIVKERTKEIGIRKALGATPFSIISMILMESVFITTLAGYFGLLLGMGIIVSINVLIGEGGDFFANPEIDISVGIGALIILVISGAITGLIPAMQAANVNPVEALKDE